MFYKYLYINLFISNITNFFVEKIIENGLHNNKNLYKKSLEKSTGKCAKSFVYIYI